MAAGLNKQLPFTENAGVRIAHPGKTIYKVIFHNQPIQAGLYKLMFFPRIDSIL